MGTPPHSTERTLHFSESPETRDSGIFLTRASPRSILDGVSPLSERASSPPKSIAILGAGPAGLAAASRLARSKHDGESEVRITLYERRKAPARKLLVAGSSGLNLTNALPIDEFVTHYTGPTALWKRILIEYPPDAWLASVRDLGSETFLGTSGRYFVREMKASRLVRAWLEDLADLGVTLETNRELREFRAENGKVVLSFAEGEERTHDAAILALGGASWEATNEPPSWLAAFDAHEISHRPFRSANVGYAAPWTEAFRKEAEGLPIKSCVFRSAAGEKAGELLITHYGLEGTPVYTFGTPGPCTIDLKPSLTENEVLVKLLSVRENLSPLRRAKKVLALGPAALALLYHLAPLAARDHLPEFARVVKNFPLTLGEPRPLTEAISSSGGIAFGENEESAVDDSLMLRKVPGVFLAGEMLDWTAPTGGFLIQGCTSMGVYAAARALEYLENGPVRTFSAKKRR